jgi:hypothetical protein
LARRHKKLGGGLGTIPVIMGNPINAVPLPPDIQRDLPAGTLVFSFDGELVFRGKNLGISD